MPSVILTANMNILTSDTELAFNDLGLNESLLAAIAAKGFERPTPIQILAIPRLLQGDANVIAKARTGTGKTAAYGLPLIQALHADTGTPRALILVPTRELALQVCVELESFKAEAYPRLAAVYGGASIVEQLRTLKSGREIIIGTPGRVMDHLERGSLHLENIEYFILDEADEMLNMGFIEDIETIFKKTNPNARVLMFSATMPKPILTVAREFMGAYEIVEEKAAEEPLPLTEQFFWMVREEDKTEALVRLIDSTDSFYGLVFCQTKADADAVAKELDERHYEAAALHGDIPQNQREKILHRFKIKKITILVATDVAARGIDIEGITHVVNYSIPYDGPTYTHRIGRTGRAGAKGTAVSFIRPNERRRIEYLRRHARGELKEQRLPSIEQVLAKKKEHIFSHLRHSIADMQQSPPPAQAFQELTQQLIDTFTLENAPFDAAALIASVLQFHYGTVLSPSHYRNIKAPRVTGETKTPCSDTIRLYIGMGRKDGAGKRSIAEFLSNLLNIPNHTVDNITLFDRFSLVTMPTNAAQKALRLSKQRKDVPHIHVDEQSTDQLETLSLRTKKSITRKLRENTRREAFYQEKEAKKKHGTGTAALYKKRKK